MLTAWPFLALLFSGPCLAGRAEAQPSCSRGVGVAAAIAYYGRSWDFEHNTAGEVAPSPVFSQRCAQRLGTVAPTGYLGVDSRPMIAAVGRGGSAGALWLLPYIGIGHRTESWTAALHLYSARIDLQAVGLAFSYRGTPRGWGVRVNLDVMAGRQTLPHLQAVIVLPGARS